MSSKIILKNVAKLPSNLPKDTLLPIFNMYSYESKGGQIVNNWVYQRGEAFLPPNREKLNLVAAMLDAEIIDQRSSGKPLSSPFKLNPKFKLRDYQVQPAHEFIEYLQEHQYGMLQGETGSGKTSTTTWVAGHFGCKILILVDMGSLQSQWQAAFKGVWDKDVQIVKSDDVTFSDVCTVTFQLLNRNPKLLDRLYEEFGVIVVDEVHASGATTYKKSLLNLNAKFKLGISATIYKKGFSDDLLTDLIGPIAVTMTDAEKIIPRILFTDSGVKWHSNHPDDFSKTLSKLALNEERNFFILQLLHRAVKEGRKTVVVAPTIKCLEWLYRESESFCKPRLYVGSTTLQQDLALGEDLSNGKIDTIFTAKKLSKGVDLPHLDCLINATPVNNKAAVVQLVGRLLRKLEGKPQPIVYDIVDDADLARTFARNRQKWYRELDFEVK